MTPLSQRIREYREAAGLTKSDLSRLVGVSDVAVGYWESGEIKQIKHVQLQALARAFGITVSELLGDEALPSLIARKQAEALETVASISDAEGEPWDAERLRHHAGVMRRQAGGCPGPGKCDDPDCPAHYTEGSQESR